MNDDLLTYLLQIIKADYLEMIHAEFEVPRSNSMAVIELKVNHPALGDLVSTSTTH